MVDGNGSIGFSRSLSTATPDHIGRHAGHATLPQTIAIDHDGIEDAFLEKGSSIWYWSGRTWLELAGAD